MGGLDICKGIVIRPINYAEQNGYLKILIGQFWEKGVVGGGLVALQFSGDLKKALELLISVRMSPLPIFSDLWVDTINPVKNKTKNNNK